MKGFSPARLAVVSALILGLMVQAGCSNSERAKSGVSATAGQESPAPAGSGERATAVNEKYGFQLDVPARWQVGTRDGQEVPTTAYLFLTNRDEQDVTIRVASGAHGGIVSDDAGNRHTLRSTKEPFTALGGEGMLFRLVRSTSANTGHWAEYHFVTTRNGFTFDISTEVAEDQEAPPAYFHEILVGWRWRTPDPSLAALGTPGELDRIEMVNEAQGWALSKGKVLRTADGGNLWTVVTPPGLADNLWGIGDEFYDANHAWLSFRSADELSEVVFHTGDGGETWAESAVRRGGNGLVYGGRLDFINPKRGWLLITPEHGMSSRPGELYQTSDGGKTWSKVAGSATLGPALENGLPFSGPFSFRDTRTGWVGGQQGAAFDPVHPLYMTQDGGRTWRPQELPLPSERAGGKLDVTAPPVFFPAGGQDGVLPTIFVPESYRASDYATLFYTTGDGGRTWREQGLLPATGPTSFATATSWWAWRDEPNASGLAAPVRGQLYRTIDGGENWTAVAPAGDLARALEKGEKVRQLDFVSEKSGWLLLETADGHGTELLQTTDGGSTWALVNVAIGAGYPP